MGKEVGFKTGSKVTVNARRLTSLGKKETDKSLTAKVFNFLMDNGF